MALLVAKKSAGFPEPAMIVIMPVLAVTLRTRPLPVSAMNMLPDGSTATSVGFLNEVLVAATLSFIMSLLLPSPATVVIKPVIIVTLRIRLLRVSAM